MLVPGLILKYIQNVYETPTSKIIVCGNIIFIYRIIINVCYLHCIELVSSGIQKI